MQVVSQETLEDGRIKITVKADADEVASAVEDVYRRFGRQATVPGFRKGKVPRGLLEQALPHAEARSEALERMAGPMIGMGLQEAGIAPFSSPELDDATAEEDGAATFVATLIAQPKVELGEYRGVAATRAAVDVTDEQLEAEVTRLRERLAQFETVNDRPAQAGDLALVDYDLVLDGQPIESQRTQGYPCQIGSDTLFPELNDKLVGLKLGEETRIPASFPADHTDAALAGKQGEFVVTLRELKQRTLPELTDEVARDVYGTPSAAELRERLRVALEGMARGEVEDRLQDELLGKIVAASQVSMAPAIIRAEAEARLRSMETELRRRGERLDDYLAQRNLDAERWLRTQEIEVRSNLERLFVLEEISRREGIKVTQDELSAEIADLARRSHTGAQEVRRQLGERGITRLADRVHSHKTLQFLVDHADITNEGQAAPSAPAAADDSQEA